MKPGLVLLATLVVVVACSEKPEAPPAPATAERIVSLAPNLTELLFTVGAGSQLVAVSAWSDYPREVLELPVVGDAFTVDQEQLALSNPDLLLVWESGTPAHVVDDLRGLGYNVVRIRTRSLNDVADALVQIGELTGHVAEAEKAAAVYRGELQSLRDRYSSLPQIRVFYQVAARPLYTINNEHYISELISVCGGENIFKDLSDLAPTVDVEAVVDRDPEVLLASTEAGDDAFAEWGRWPEMSANRIGNHFLLPADEIGRATTRVIIAGNAMCLALQQARINRDSAARG
ncbi:MAG: cobalamin-binding protein [Woeseiaceae bacterium]|nr:cobalamin-binding protein [Woeseiaceae bacterium]